MKKSTEILQYYGEGEEKSFKKVKRKKLKFTSKKKDEKFVRSVLNKLLFSHFSRYRVNPDYRWQRQETGRRLQWKSGG